MDKLINKSVELSIALWEPDYSEGRCQVFSYAFFKSRLIAVGRNKAKSHPINIRNPLILRHNGERCMTKGVCGELDLFIKIRNLTNIRFNKLNIINVRLDKNKIIKNSRPCSSCESLCKWMNPNSLYYSTDEGKFQIYI